MPKIINFIFIKKNILIILLGLILSVFYGVSRIPFHSKGLDQWDVVLYKDSLEKMQYFREAKWPTLLMIQKFIWFLKPNLTAAEVLSVTNIFLASGSIFLTYLLMIQISNSIILGILSILILFFSPIFNVYSIIGMQDMPQTFFLLFIIFLALKALQTKRIFYFYAFIFLFGLTLGVRLVHIILFPPLFFIFLSRRWKQSQIINLIIFFILSLLIWWLFDFFFVKEMDQANSILFFINQIKLFNIFKIGLFFKLSSYPLFTGYPMSLFYRFPFVLYMFYILLQLLRFTKKINNINNNSIYRFIYVNIFSLIAIALFLRFKNTKLEYFYFYIFFILSSLVLEFFFIFKHKLRKLDIQKFNTEYQNSFKAFLIGVIFIYISFNLLFTGPVARYLLPIFPLFIILLIFVFTDIKLPKFGFCKFIPGFLIFFLFYISFPNKSIIILLNEFSKLDTRSSVSKFINTHDGVYFDLSPGGIGLSTYLSSYKVINKIKPINLDRCSKDFYRHDYYIITYGSITSEIINKLDLCNLKYKKVASFTRNEIVIEDSVGNLGFYIYKINSLDQPF